MSKTIVNIFFGYEWGEKGLQSSGYKAFKQICNQVIKDIGNSDLFVKNSYIIVNRRLRASAGGYLFEKIYTMIKNADILIFDISEGNMNVMIELGIAFAFQREFSKNLDIFLMKEEKDSKKTPSDINNYFISTYTFKNSKIKFNDNNSLRMSLKNSVKKILIDNNLTKDKIENVNLDWD